MLRPLVVVLVLFYTSVAFAQGETSPIINVCGKSYEITGDFMTIVIAKNIVYGAPETLAPKVIDQINRQYEVKVDSLLARRGALELSDEMVRDSMKRLKVELGAAEVQAMALAREFATVDLKTTSYLYQLAYYFFGNGQLAEALEVMSDEALAKIELSQAKKYVLKAAALKRLGDFEACTATLKTASERYPCFASRSNYGQQLTANAAEGCGIEEIASAIEMAGSPGERSRGYLLLANAFLCAGEVEKAHRAADTVVSLHKDYHLDAPQEITEAYSIMNTPVLTPREQAERYLKQNDLARFDQIMREEEVSNFELPFSMDAYELKVLYVRRLKLTDAAAAKKAEKLVRKYLKKKKGK